MGSHVFSQKRSLPAPVSMPAVLGHSWYSLTLKCRPSFTPKWQIWRGRNAEGEIMVWFSLFSSLKEGRETKQVGIWHADGFFPLCLRSFVLASSIWGSLQHDPKSAIPQKGIQGSCVTLTAVPTSPCYTSWKSGPQFAKKRARSGFFSWLSLSPLLKAIYLNCTVSFSLQLSAIFHKISSLITILLLLLWLFEGAMRWSFPDVALYESEKPG